MNILVLTIDEDRVRAALVNSETSQPVDEICHVDLIPDRPVRHACEVKPESLWQAVSCASRQAANYRDDVHGIVVGVASPVLVLVDRNDRPLGPIWMPSDRRARVSARQILARAGDEFLQSIGCKPAQSAVSIIGFHRRLIGDPYLTHDVAKYLHLNGWLALRMTGETAYDPANASATGLYNTTTDQQWSPRWCDFFEVDLDWLPPVLNGDTTIGNLRSQAATDLGIPAGIPVKLGSDIVSGSAFAADLKADEQLHFDGPKPMSAVRTNEAKPHEDNIVRRFGFGDGFLRMADIPIGEYPLPAVSQHRADRMAEYSEADIRKITSTATLAGLAKLFAT